MNRRLVPAALGAAALLMAVAGTATADPTATPGQPPANKAPNQIFSAVGADAFAELTNNLTTVYNAQSGAARTLASYDAVNPVTGAPGENIATKPGCSVARPNGANAGIAAILAANSTSSVDTSENCVDWVRSSRSKGTAAGEQNLTFYTQSRDVVSYAVLGNAYAPTTPLSTTQLKSIFLCQTTDWSQVGGQAGAIHVYLPPASAATLTYFLQTGLGITLADVNTGCGSTTLPSQQNDGRTLNGDPQGITPYTVTKWAAQDNEPAGVPDYRGGVQLGLLNDTTPPTTTRRFDGQDYQVLSDTFGTGQSASFSRFFYNVTRNNAQPALTDVFKAGGFLCTNSEALLVPYGNQPLTNTTTAQQYCGKPS